MAAVEKHRQHLLATSGRYLAEQKRIADVALLQKQRQKVGELKGVGEEC